MGRAEGAKSIKKKGLCWKKEGKRLKKTL